MGTRIGLLKIPVLNLLLCLVLYTCFAFYCISAVLRDRCWFCCSVLTATVINEHYYYYNNWTLLQAVITMRSGCGYVDAYFTGSWIRVLCRSRRGWLLLGSQASLSLASAAFTHSEHCLHHIIHTTHLYSRPVYISLETCKILANWHNVCIISITNICCMYSK